MGEAKNSFICLIKNPVTFSSMKTAKRYTFEYFQDGN